MDYYSTLGVSKNASDQEIKKAYRKLAMKHHPDRGGDQQKFAEIQSAYDVLSDPQKRQLFDIGADPNRQGGFNRGPFEFHFGDNMEDIFSQFGFGGAARRPKNQSFNIPVEIDLIDVLTGKDISAQVTDPQGKAKIININVPPGIQEGQQIRYEGMGDQTNPQLPPGDLFVIIKIRLHPQFERHNNDLLLEKTISVWDAMIGGKLQIKTLDGKNLNINIPKGTQPDTFLSCKGEGLPDLRTKRRGNLMIKLKIQIPKNLTESQIGHLQNARNAKT